MAKLIFLTPFLSKVASKLSTVH